MNHKRSDPLDVEVWETFPPCDAIAAENLAAMTLGTLSVETDAPDAHQPTGVWYCPGKDCPVLEFSAEFKLYGNPAPQAACCPCCRTKATHLGWRRTVPVHQRPSRVRCVGIEDVRPDPAPSSPATPRGPVGTTSGPSRLDDASTAPQQSPEHAIPDPPGEPVMSPPTQPSAPRELADSPVRFVLSQPNADGAPDSGNVVLACPVCACPEVHIGQAAVMQRATLVLHRDDGMHASPANVNRRRGSYVALRFWCEQGHAFRYEYLFTKGATHVRLLTGGYDPQGEHELWRE